jgi:hypothetical protein
VVQVWRACSNKGDVCNVHCHGVGAKQIDASISCERDAHFSANNCAAGYSFNYQLRISKSKEIVISLAEG